MRRIVNLREAGRWSAEVLAVASIAAVAAIAAMAAAQAPASLSALAAAARRQPPAQVLPRIGAWLQQHPRDSEAWKLQAAVQLQLKQPEAAMASLEHVLALRPTDTRVRVTLLQMLADSPRCERVSASAAVPRPATSPCAARLRQLWAGLPPAAQKDAAVEVLQVRVQMAEGDRTQALATAGRLARQHANDAKVQFTLGAELLQAGEAAAALPRLRAAQHLLGPGATDDALDFDLALAHFQLGDAQAEKEFQELHRRHPNDWQPVWYLAQLDMRTGNWSGAAALLVAAQQQHADQPTVAAALAELAARQQFWLDAVDEWQIYRRLRPDDTGALEQLAIAAQMGHEAKLALQTMRTYLAARPDDPRGHYLIALMEKDQGDLAAARRELNTVLRLNPREDRAWTTLGQMELSTGHVAAADANFRKALQIAPANADALTGEAQCQSRQGHSDAALQLLRQAVQHQPQEVAAWYQLSLLARRAGQPSLAQHAASEFRRQQAARPVAGGRGLLAYLKADVRLSPAQQRAHYIAFLQQALATRPDDPRIVSRLGIAWLQSGDAARALPMLQRIAGQPMPTGDAQRTGEALLTAHQPQLALRFLQAAAASTGTSAEVRLAVDEARAWLQQNQPNRALQALAQVPATAQPTGVAADLAALIYAAAGDDAHAIAAFRVALETGAGQPAITRDAATFLGSRGRWAEALDVVREARRQVPDSPELALDEAIFLQLAGHHAEAQQQLRALAFDPADPALSPAQRRAAVLLGISYYTSDDRPQAEALFRQLTEAAPKLPQPWYYRALLASEGNHAGDALAWVRRSLQLDPDSAEAWYLEGKLLATDQQLSAAHSAFEKAIQCDPVWSAPHFALARVLRDQGDATAAAAQLTTFHQLSKGEAQGEKQQLRSFLQEQVRASAND